MTLLINNNDSFTHNIIELLRQITDQEVHIITNGGIELDKVEDYQRIIFSPGPGLPDDFPIMKEILNRYQATKPILGICLGHQAICEYFGARIERLDKVVHGVDSIINCNEYSRLFRGKDTMVVGRYHSWVAGWAADEMPDYINIIATDSDGNIMAVEHSILPIYGVQFHPESYISKGGLSIFENFING